MTTLRSTIVAVFLISVCHGQIVLSALSTAVTENFSALGTSATAELPSGWKMTTAGVSNPSWGDAASVSTTTAQASSGSPVNAHRYNWGQDTTDRALGFMTSGSYASPNSILAQVQNNTGSALTDFTVQFDYERYRINTSAAQITFFYSTNGSTWTAATAGDSGAFSTGTSSYTFSTPTTVSKSVTLSSLNIEQSGSLYLRWNFNTTGGNSQGLGLDNFSISGSSAVPEPSTYAAILGAAALVGATVYRRRFRKRATSRARRPDAPTDS